MKPGPTIIPVASGKGGVGKSFVTANLAAALADLGHRVIAVDLDLGGSNLFAFLGLSNRHPGIGDFLKARTAELEDLLVPTPIANLRFLAGDGRTPFMANIPHGQKLRLISRLKSLPAEYVLLDLSAGAAFNTLDFFRLSPFGLVVTLPEYPAIINLMTFLKHVLIRTIEKAFSGDPSIRYLLGEIYKMPSAGRPLDIALLKEKAAAVDPAAAETIAALCRRFRPRILFNKGEQPEDMNVSRQISAGLRKVLSIEGDYFGLIYRDPGIRLSTNGRHIHLRHFPDSPAAVSIRQTAERIVAFWEKPIDRSAQRIMAHARKMQPAAGE